MKYPYILWDLDGTLTDSGSGITKSVQYALRRFGIESETEPLKVFVGPPLADSFMKYFGFDEPTARQAVEVYREYYREHGIFDNEVYAGIPALLEKLCAAGCKCILATAKPIVFADRILEHFDLMKYFTHTYGPDLPGHHIDKADIIADAIAGASIDVSRAVMIGDRDSDVIGAHKCGMDAIGVLYGYGSHEEMASSGAEAIAATVEELAELLG